MEKKTFETPIIEVTELDTCDIISTSDVGGGQKAGYEEDDFENLLG